MLDAMGITYPQYLVLNVLGEGDGATVGAIAARLALESSTITPPVKRLEQAGLVERRVDLTDKRARLLHVTAEGRAVAAEVEERTATIRAELFAGVDDADLIAATRVFDHLYAVFGDERE
jgi:DNA-binding MarR family transcriptional regulator